MARTRVRISKAGKCLCAPGVVRSCIKAKIADPTVDNPDYDTELVEATRKINLIVEDYNDRHAGEDMELAYFVEHDDEDEDILKLVWMIEVDSEQSALNS